MSTILNGQLSSNSNLSGAISNDNNLSGVISLGNSGGGGTNNYNDLDNKPQINNVILSGNKTTSDLGLFSGDYNDLTNKPTIPAAQVNSDWNSNSGVSEILNKPTLATVATTGDYTDLNHLPKINGMTIEGNRTSQWYGFASKLNDLSDVSLSLELSEFEILIYNSYLNKWINSKMSYNWLIDKPSIPDAQVQSDYAQSDNTKVDYIKNKPDISAMIEQAIYDILPVASVSSSPVATFNTEIAAPLQEIKCEITPEQSGEGTPSPSNPRPISGYTEANITSNGDTYTIAFGQTVYGGVLDVTSGKLTVTQYYKSIGDLNWSYNSGYGFYTSKDSSLWGDYNPKGISNIKIANMKCDIYETDTYQNVTGGITNFHIAQGLTYMAISDNRYTDGATFKSAMKGHYIAYELATPFEIDLTPVQINAIVGDNTVSADCGNTAVKYKDTIQHYIDIRT